MLSACAPIIGTSQILARRNNTGTIVDIVAVNAANHIHPTDASGKCRRRIARNTPNPTKTPTAPNTTAAVCSPKNFPPLKQ